MSDPGSINWKSETNTSNNSFAEKIRFIAGNKYLVSF